MIDALTLFTKFISSLCKFLCFAGVELFFLFFLGLIHLEHTDFLFLRFFATTDSDVTSVDADVDANEQDVCSNDKDDGDGDGDHMAIID